MGYDYYCSHCGKQLNQRIVLFDMQYLLTRSKERQFNILKYRMTQEQLKALISAGVPSENGYRRCKLTLANIMAYISNPYNLNDSAICQVTLEEITRYLEEGFITAKAAAVVEDDDPYGFDDDEETQEEEEQPKEEKPPYEVPACIRAIEEKDIANKDRVFVKSALRNDFEVLQGLFALNDVFEFEIKEENDVDNEGHDVLIGYNLNLAIGGYLNIDARVCCKCGNHVFAHAGTAKHQAVAFIGYAASGKTSTILALTHYADNYMITGFGSDIWEGSRVITSAATVEVLDKSARLIADLKSYQEGVAPPKTEASQRTDAYSATFRIKNKAQNRYYLLTLTDLPGELCNDDGTVQKENVYNNFPVALSCDAFVACFDTRSINEGGGGGSGVVDKVMNVCRWADEFQKMRASHNQVKTYVPTMLLFTKCKDLEDGTVAPLSRRILLPLERMYTLKEEKQHIAGNNLYRFVCDQFNEFGQLRKAYHAMMRCSPYGYKAPSENDLKHGTAEVHPPMPKNIDQLMYWLLCVAGCIPTEATFAISPTDVPYRLDKFCISRPQLRNENPGLENSKKYAPINDVEEAMARCALFENPGKFDKDFVANHGDKWRLVWSRTKAKASPDSNDKED